MQLFSVQRFWQILGTAHGDALFAVPIHCGRRKSNNRNGFWIFAGLNLANRLGSRQAIHFGHLFIHQNEINRGVTFKTSHSKSAVLGSNRAASHLHDYSFRQFEIDFTVIDQTNLAREFARGQSRTHGPGVGFPAVMPRIFCRNVRYSEVKGRPMAQLGLDANLPMMSTSRLATASSSQRACVCRNGSNTRRWFSGEIPMPVSVTRNSSILAGEPPSLVP